MARPAALRKVHDDAGRDVDISALPGPEQLRAILRYSAIPGTSRHHWGTDLDVYDAAAVPAGYQLELSPPEVAAGGLFDPLHRWLDERMAAGESRGFYRPYAAGPGRSGAGALAPQLCSAGAGLRAHAQREPAAGLLGGLPGG